MDFEPLKRKNSKWKTEISEEKSALTGIIAIKWNKTYFELVL